MKEIWSSSVLVLDLIDNINFFVCLISPILLATWSKHMETKCIRLSGFHFSPSRSSSVCSVEDWHLVVTKINQNALAVKNSTKAKAWPFGAKLLLVNIPQNYLFSFSVVHKSEWQSEFKNTLSILTQHHHLKKCISKKHIQTDLYIGMFLKV